MHTNNNNTNTSEYSPSTPPPAPETAEPNETPLTAEPAKPRSEWDEDERLDGRAKTDSIRVLVVPPGAAPYSQIIGNNLDAMQAVVSGLITTFETGIEGVIGIANDEALVDDLPLNRMIPATGAGIFGTFFLAGDGINVHSLSDGELARCTEVFNEPIISASTVNEAAVDKPKTLWVVVVPPGVEPYALAIGNSPEDFEALLDGPPYTVVTQLKGVLALCSAEAARNNLPLRRLNAGCSHENTQGTFICIGISELHDECISLTPQQREDCIAAYVLKVEVVVFPPDALPFVATITSNPETGYLPDLQRIIAGADIHTARPFNVSTFNVPVVGAVGLCHQSNTDGTVLTINENHFPPNRRVIYMPSMFYGTFVVAAGTDMDDLSSVTPQILEKLLDAFAPELEHSQFEQVMHGLSAGAEYMANWD